MRLSGLHQRARRCIGKLLHPQLAVLDVGKLLPAQNRRQRDGQKKFQIPVRSKTYDPDPSSNTTAPKESRADVPSVAFPSFQTVFPLSVIITAFSRCLGTYTSAVLPTGIVTSIRSVSPDLDHDEVTAP